MERRRKGGGKKERERERGDNGQNQHLLSVNYEPATFTNGSPLLNINHFSPETWVLIKLTLQIKNSSQKKLKQY